MKPLIQRLLALIAESKPRPRPRGAPLPASFLVPDVDSNPIHRELFPVSYDPCTDEHVYASGRREPAYLQWPDEND